MVTRFPRPGTAVGWTAGAVIALYPGMLPRPVPVELALLIVLGVVGVLVARLGAAVLRPVAVSAGRHPVAVSAGRHPVAVSAGRHPVAVSAGRLPVAADRTPDRVPRRARRCATIIAAVLLAVPVAVLVAAVLGWCRWQQRLRAAAGVDPLPAVGIALLLVVAALPFLFAALPPRLRRRAAVVAVASAVGIGAVGPAHAADEGHRFLTAASATPGVRVYVPLGDSGGDRDSDTSRADRAVDELLADGALRRAAIVVAVPTGSGWVDAHFVRGVEDATGGDVTIVAVQYTAEPSWESYVLHRDRVIGQARALAAAMHRRLPPTAPPLLVYGQSLGALGAAAFTAAYAAEPGPAAPISGTLLAGTPAGVADPPGPVTRLLNRSDPVGVFSAELAWRPATVRAGDGAPTPRPPWAPGLSWLQTAVDLIGATGQPSGTGHRYDEAQGRILAGYLVGESAAAGAA